ncbi:MAG TPA: glycosyltransferase 61 family protein [Bryobacteraceae bacterium]|nr:glycosyltransferase 61 family protein [Bryobacteraceae bacterium]
MEREETLIESLLEPFRAHAISIRSIVRAGCGEFLQANGGRLSKTVYREAGSDESLDKLAEIARELAGCAAGEDLLLVPAALLSERLAATGDHFPFRAVAAWMPHAPDPVWGPGAWRLRRAMFDCGLICMASVVAAQQRVYCFLASDQVHSFGQLDVEPRGYIAFAKLSDGVGFANQLFRYAFAEFYALRHGLTLACPDWAGNDLFGFHDPPTAELDLPTISYPGFADNDRELWDVDDPPIDINFEGYFQEIPDCWRKHRPLLRNLFQVPAARSPLDDWYRQVTDRGCRTLVAIHVRRGDYREFQKSRTPWFRLVPEDLYLDWLRNLWPTLRNPVLFVATDEPDAVLPAFAEFQPVSFTPGSFAAGLPGFVWDFEILQRADYLAICNSSYSRMAAILAPSTQKCFIPSFQTRMFEPYEPWIDPGFWVRFADSWGDAPHPVEKEPAPAPLNSTALYFDVTDLVLYLLHHGTLTGIQRVQGEILRHLPANDHSQPVRFVVLHRGGSLFAVDESILLPIIENVCSGALTREDAEYELREMLALAVPSELRSGDTLIEIGAFWNVGGTGRVLQRLKRAGVRVGVFLHDIIPIETPEYFESASTSVFVKAIVEAFTFADFLVTTSEYNRVSIAARLSGRFEPIPIALVPLGHGLSHGSADEPEVSTAVAAILDREYVLCVGTIEVRKNPGYLLNIWKLMSRNGRSRLPDLVFVGRQGWLVKDFMHQLEACNFLNGRVVVLHGVSDVELDLLYQNCLLTMLPSFVEGWGLPVGESLAHGKICIASDAGGIPEAGGTLVDYIDPYNVRDGMQTLIRYLEDPELRSRRERDIAENFRPRAWREVTDTLLSSIRALSCPVPAGKQPAAISLPRDRFLPISSDPPAVLMDEIDGRLSAELICVSGWHPPQIGGVRPSQPVSEIRFRADAPAGSKINLVLRMAAVGGDFRVRICSGSGSQTEVRLTDAGEKITVLACMVEAGSLVTARLLSIGAALAGEEFPDASYWTLKGVLYFDPKATAAAPPSPAPHRTEEAVVPAEILLRRRVVAEDMERASSFGAFQRMSDAYWQSEFIFDRKPPLFADDEDRQRFLAGCGNPANIPALGRVSDCVQLVRRSDVFVSTSRFTEGSVFDREGVWKGEGYLQQAPAEHNPWISRGPHGLSASEKSLAAAPEFDGTWIIFYNGNLHNYYHWLVEGLVGLDLLAGTAVASSSLTIALPKSMDIAALLDHRESLQAIGLGAHKVIEIGSPLIKVREAIWIEPSLVQSMPKPYLKNFQQRIATLPPGNPGRARRLLVARRGPTRMIHNLDEVESFLAGYGFQTVFLEGMSMQEQLLLFRSAEFVIGPHGAGLANLLFCSPGTKVIELMPEVELRTFFWLISQKLDLVHAMQFCPMVGGAGFQSSIRVDLGKLGELYRRLSSAGASNGAGSDEN